MVNRTCSIEDCGRPTIARGWCTLHYQRWKKSGDPLAKLPWAGGRQGRPRPPEDPWSKIDSTVGPDECWPWSKSHDRDGYAVVKIGNRQWRVARWVLTQKLGRDILPTEVTRHTCDNPPCCNPAHLIVGTARDNTADMLSRGRSITGDAHWTRRAPERMRGTRNAAAKLTDDQVRDIRQQYAGGARQVDLASQFGVSQTLISQIVRRAVWKHIA